MLLHHLQRTPTDFWSMTLGHALGLSGSPILSEK
jgi:hypothetical protein